jgi:Ion channel
MGGGGFLVPLRRMVRSRILPRRHTILLGAIVVAFLVRPLIGHTSVGLLVFSTTFMALLLLSLYTIQVDELVGDRDVLLAERRRRSLVGWTLALLAIGERLLLVVAPSRHLYLVASLIWLLALCFVTWSELRSALRHKEVTGETISMSVSVYLMFGLNWALLYAVIFQLQPGAFRLDGSPFPPEGSSPDVLQVVPAFIYFSLITLTTIGYGDITPVTPQARYAALAEGITGQLYLAILVARLVGLYMAGSAGPDRNRSAPRLPDMPPHAAGTEESRSPRDPRGT